MMRDIRNNVTEEWRNFSIDEIINKLDEKYPDFKTNNANSKKISV